MYQLPRYDDLPEASGGGRSGWALFGSDDNIGMLNLQTPERVVAAARLVRKGSVFALNAAIDAFAPSYVPSRVRPRHRLLHEPGALSFDDVYDDVFPQGSSQWDALGHMGYAPGVFYNGASEDDIVAGRRNTIEHWARRGIVGRAVLLDMPRTFAELERAYDPAQGGAFTVDDLEMARERSGVTFEHGDVLLLHTGFAAWYLQLPAAQRARLADAQIAPGLSAGEPMCRYLWNVKLAAIASDTVAVEALPRKQGGPMSFLHRMLIGQFGMALGELWWTEDLAADCAADGVHEALLVSAPWHAPGAVGSPANALAIK